MRTIKLIELANENWEGSSRDFGRLLADKVRPGDRIDFTDFFLISNSFVDEFVKNFVKNFGFEFLETLEFINAPSLFLTLFEVAKRRCLEKDERQRSDFNFPRISILDVLREAV